MNQWEVYRHFRRFKPKNNTTADYCQRCSVFVGEGFVNKNIKEWKGFKLCEDCYEDKINKKKAGQYDLEDLDKTFQQRLINGYRDSNYIC